ncbi:Isc10p KNAG_0G01970 [Huiozyma naganishii CBS 8797]|uniref:Uncharacterized protein n=1 Tax=Huiozyma naganishii (strain ATCC MYA-139 / BCRC 22969 / CBS 8797 / KCTC 17520 / NBRC 10181 / NCYC 3082 / Yp74L-3) TaxID=1071383 RepID=J7S7Z0_HUIN7|nr:hypothetical protein KNAG_0G01970 [Kazachstania naganishii CBS 8797]CCK71254.1 hypothetical protein KNAG_0G01970 [Kazachstania naganishii CBS 8797]
MKSINVNSNGNAPLRAPSAALKSTRRARYRPQQPPSNKRYQENYELNVLAARMKLFKDLTPPVSESSQPEAIGQNRDTDIGRLGKVNTQYIPASPAVRSDLETNSINFSVLLRTVPINNDCTPLVHMNNYEYRFDDNGVHDDMLLRETGRKCNVFPEEMEYNELHSVISKWDWLKYHLFGIDKFDFFELHERRKQFYACPWNYSRIPLRMRDESEC